MRQPGQIRRYRFLRSCLTEGIFTLLLILVAFFTSTSKNVVRSVPSVKLIFQGNNENFKFEMFELLPFLKAGKKGTE